jgi:hypothetical protein
MYQLTHVFTICSATADAGAEAKQGSAADFEEVSRENEWCCQTGLNCRPLHYQWSALPLSYGSMPRMRESARKAPATCAVPCHKATGRASAGAACGHRKRPKISARRPRHVSQPHRLRACPVPHFAPDRLKRLDRGGSCLELGHFACFVESDQVDELSPAEKSTAASPGPAIKSPVGLFSTGAVMEALPVRTGRR